MNADGGLGYLIKTFGATKADVTFNRLPKVIQAAREAIPEGEVVGYLMCALDRPPQMTGLIFCDHRHYFPQGLPMRTPSVVERFYRGNYLVVRALGGGLYVVAHWYYENGALRPFFEVH